MIGDPGGKDSERNMQTLEQLDKNYTSIHAQVQFVMANVLEIA